MPQNYKNHKLQIVALETFVFLSLFSGLLAAGLHVYSSLETEQELSSGILLGMFLISAITIAYLVFFSMRARADIITAEENIRHYKLTRTTLPNSLSSEQIAALRFSSDAEFPELTGRTTTENLTPDDIKKSIHHWRADYRRT